MNKTININLAGLFFHIDEDAYNRLQRYMVAIRHSFAGTMGADEIMSDIESRIAELFLEKRSNELQVISIVHVEEVIAIMGQPEDYEVDEDIFEGPNPTGPNSKNINFNRKNKQLFRDTQNGYIGGVSSGLSYYLGMETVWVRVIWIVLLFLTAGWALPIYILLWIFVPDAVTTNQRLTMMGKEVNITNIENNFKAGFEPVVDGTTDANHRIIGQKSKRGTVRLFGFIGRFIKGILKVIVKIFGLLIFLTSTILLVALVVSTITASAIDIDGYSLLAIFDWVIPTKFASFWFVLALILTAGIPLFLMAVLGLKLLVNKLRSLGSRVYISLAVVWIIAVIALSIMAGRIMAQQAIDASVQKTEKFGIRTDSVFSLNLIESDQKHTFNRNGVGIEFEEINGIPSVKYYDVRVAVAPTNDSLARVELNLKGKGANFEEAKNKAKLIKYDFKLTDSTFTAPDYFVLPQDAGIGYHDIEVVIYLPEGTLARFNERFGERYRSYINKDAFNLGNNIEYTYLIQDGKAVCQDCPVVDESINTKMEDTIVPVDSLLQDPPDNDGQWKYDGIDGVEKNEQP